MELENITLKDIMSTGRFEDYKFSKKLISIFSEAIRQPVIAWDIADLDRDEHFNNGDIPVTAWHQGTDSDEPGDWTIWIYRDPVTESTRIIGGFFDSHGLEHLTKIV